MAVTIGPVVVIGEHEEAPDIPYVRLLPFPWDAHYYPWWSDTTRKVLESMVNFTDLTVIDMGCGSSAILALAAARLGAKRVWAIDQQKSLCEVAERQIEANGLSHVIEVVAGEQPPEHADVMLANVGDAHLVGQISTWATHGIGTDNDGNLLTW